jgi:hypothetical protein
MADPTHTQDDFKVRSLDVVHINPSIMEGEKLYTSVLGPDIAVPIERYAPINLQPPVVTGSDKIPSILTCSQGAWDSSPSPNFFYQWTADGVDIPGETGRQLLTYSDLDSMEIGCTVTAVNFLGMVEVPSSNTILVGIIEPIWMQEMDFAGITGLNQYEQQNLMNMNIAVATGLWVDIRQDMMTKVECVMSGLWVDNRHDVMGFSGYTVSGSGLPTKQIVYESDSYMVEYYVFNETIVPVNNEFENGLTGWLQSDGTTDNRSFTVRTDGPKAGTKYVAAPYTTGEYTLTQLIDIPASHWVLIDEYNKMANLTYYVKHFGSFATWYGIEAYLQFFDDTGSFLGSDSLDRVAPYLRKSDVWEPRQSESSLLPVGTRRIGIVIRTTSINNSSYAIGVDDLNLHLYDAYH